LIDGSVGDGWARVRFSGRAEGDMGHAGAYIHEVDPVVGQRRRDLVDLPWTWLRQVHGAESVSVLAPGDGAGSVADATYTKAAGAALAILTADCAPVALASPEGVIGAVHAGWSGLVAGVVESTVDAMRAAGAGEVHAIIGPCIRPGCYEFGPAELDTVAARLGDGVRARTADGRPALDLLAGVLLALGRAGVAAVDSAGGCTSCAMSPSTGGGPAWFSWRARRETQRQAMVVWR
jgi:YfiH family protein